MMACFACNAARSLMLADDACPVLGTDSHQIFHPTRLRVRSGRPLTCEHKYKFHNQALLLIWFNDKII